MEYDVLSEEYDVGVVFAPKQRKLKKNDYLKINSPWNHMKPAIQVVGTNYHKYLPKYLN